MAPTKAPRKPIKIVYLDEFDEPIPLPADAIPPANRRLANRALPLTPPVNGEVIYPPLPKVYATLQSASLPPFPARQRLIVNSQTSPRLIPNLVPAVHGQGAVPAVLPPLPALRRVVDNNHQCTAAGISNAFPTQQASLPRFIVTPPSPPPGPPSVWAASTNTSTTYGSPETPEVAPFIGPMTEAEYEHEVMGEYFDWDLATYGRAGDQAAGILAVKPLIEA